MIDLIISRTVVDQRDTYVSNSRQLVTHIEQVRVVSKRGRSCLGCGLSGVRDILGIVSCIYVCFNINFDIALN